MKKCKVCNKEFKVTRKDKECCDKKCSSKYWRIKYPEKAKIKDKKYISPYNSQIRKNWYNKKKKSSEYVERIKKQARDRYKKMQDFLNDYKMSKGCQDCKYKENPVALDFDHVRGKKLRNVSQSKSISQAKIEMKKCEVVCSNCHRIRTFNRINNKL